MFPPFCSTHMLLIFIFSSCTSRRQRLLTEKVVFPELSACFINAAKMTKEEEGGGEDRGDERTSFFMVSLLPKGDHFVHCCICQLPWHPPLTLSWRCILDIINSSPPSVCCRKQSLSEHEGKKSHFLSFSLSIHVFHPTTLSFSVHNNVAFCV